MPPNLKLKRIFKRITKTLGFRSPPSLSRIYWRSLLTCLLFSPLFMDWAFMPSPKFICGSPDPQRDVLWRWGLGPMMGLISLWKEEETPEHVLVARSLSSLILTLMLSAIWKHSKKAAICKQGIGLSPGTTLTSILIFNFPAPRTGRNKCLLFKEKKKNKTETKAIPSQHYPKEIWYRWWKQIKKTLQQKAIH